MIIFGYAFRVFFLLGGIAAVVTMIFWPLELVGMGPLVTNLNPVFWHAHEMTFGFAAAIIAGFVLTAVAVWTGRERIHGVPLMVLSAAWVSARLAMAISSLLPELLVAVVDFTFFSVLTLLLAREVILSGNKRNYPIVVMVAGLAVADLMFHLGTVYSPGLAYKALFVSTLWVLMLVAVIAGRIIPAFTANWLRQHGVANDQLPRTLPALDAITLTLTFLAVLCLTFIPMHIVTGIVAIAASLAHAIRLSQWSGLRTTKEPLLFVLHVAYGWYPAGFALTGLAAFGFYPLSVAIHALTIGVIGTMILAMISRVSLGHTGRPLRVGNLIVLAYILLFLAVVMRLSGPLFSDHYIETVLAAAFGWIAAYSLFLWVYWPMLATDQ